jgi:hypothetical protein
VCRRPSAGGEDRAVADVRPVSWAAAPPPVICAGSGKEAAKTGSAVPSGEQAPSDRAARRHTVRSPRPRARAAASTVLPIRPRPTKHRPRRRGPVDEPMAKLHSSTSSCCISAITGDPTTPGHLMPFPGPAERAPAHLDCDSRFPIPAYAPPIASDSANAFSNTGDGWADGHGKPTTRPCRRSTREENAMRKIGSIMVFIGLLTMVPFLAGAPAGAKGPAPPPRKRRRGVPPPPPLQPAARSSS